MHGDEQAAFHPVHRVQRIAGLGAVPNGHHHLWPQVHRLRPDQ
jgi:hypothetical protein